MKIYLIKSPEYEKDSFDAVCDFLIATNQSLCFIKNECTFESDNFPFLKKYYPDFTFEYPTLNSKMLYDNGRLAPLSWQELFSLCDFHRTNCKIGIDDFVVLLTKRRNALNWFSKYDTRKNIFVHTDDWQFFTNVDAIYPIAYQVTCNILRIIMKLTYADLNGPYVHKQAIGCMNDFCSNKKEVILKLQTANICNKCIEKMQVERIDNPILLQVGSIFEKIRAQFTFNNLQSKNNSSEPLFINITQKFKITIGTNELKLTPLRKTLYLFFLRNKLHNAAGIYFINLQDNKSELLQIYKSLRKGNDIKKMTESINSLVSVLNNNFSMEKARVNEAIVKLMGEQAAKKYKISGERLSQYKIMLACEHIKFEL